MIPDRRGQQALKVLKAFRVHRARRVSKAPKDLRDLRDLKVLLGLKAIRGRRDKWCVRYKQTARLAVMARKLWCRSSARLGVLRMGLSAELHLPLVFA